MPFWLAPNIVHNWLPLHSTYLDYNDYSSLWLSGLTIDVLQ